MALPQNLIDRVNAAVAGWRAEHLPESDDAAWQAWLDGHKCCGDQCFGGVALLRDPAAARLSIRKRILAGRLAPVRVASLGVHAGDEKFVAPLPIASLSDDPSLIPFIWEVVDTFGRMVEEDGLNVTVEVNDETHDLVHFYNDLLLRLCRIADETLMHEIVASYHPYGTDKSGLYRFFHGTDREPSLAKRRLLCARLHEVIREELPAIHKGFAENKGDPYREWRESGYRYYASVVRRTLRSETWEPELIREELAFFGTIDGGPFPYVSDREFEPVVKILAGDDVARERMRWVESFFRPKRPQFLMIAEEIALAERLATEFEAAGDPRGIVPEMRAQIDAARRAIATRAVQRLEWDRKEAERIRDEERAAEALAARDAEVLKALGPA